MVELEPTKIIISYLPSDLMYLLVLRNMDKILIT